MPPLRYTLPNALATPAADRSETSGSSAARFLSSYEEPLTQYRAYRRMHARSERFNQEAWLGAVGVGLALHPNAQRAIIF